MHCCRALTLALAMLYCTVGRYAAACLCRTWAWLGLMPSGCLLYCCSSGPAQMMTPMMTSHFVIFHAIQRRKFHAFIHRKGFDFCGTKSYHWHQIPYRALPRPHWRTSQTPLLHARPVFRGGLRWLNPRCLHKNFWCLPLCGMTNN